MATGFLDSCSVLAELWWTRLGGLPAGAIARYRLSALVAHARAHSPFYRERYRGLPTDPALADLPPVARSELMSRFDDWGTDRQVSRAGVEAFLARRPVGSAYLGRYRAWTSSGTSGTPGIFLQDAHALTVYDALVAAQFQSLAWTPAGVARMAAGGGRAALVAAVGGHYAGIASWEHLRHAYPGLDARSFSVMTPMPELVAALNDFRPATLAAYPSVLALLAEERAAGRLAIELALAWSGGEHLAPAARAAIERGLGCHVIEEYGASECLSIAHGCARGVLHVNADWVVLEGVDRDGGPVQPGATSHTTLLTNLANRVQPVIRYDLGDRITPLEGPCACGSPLPAIRVEGRKDDIVTLRGPRGARVRLPPLALATVVEEAAGVLRFQLVQDSPRHLAMRIEAGPARAVAWKRAAPALRAYLDRHGLANVGVTLARDLPRADAASGKLRAVVVQPSVEEGLQRSGM